jgi:GntR family transcriptional regulator/MocR family aminotransferase
MPLQTSIASYLGRMRGVHCHADQVVLITSFQQSFQLAARLLTEPGDTIALEDPHRLGVRNAFLAHGLRLKPVPADAEGLLPDRLPASGTVRLLYVSPSHLWPSGAILPLARRLRILEWARQHGAWILENDHNSEYAFPGTPEVSLQGLDKSDRVLYVGTFSRLTSPDTQIAYLVVPPALVAPFRAARTLESYTCPQLEIEALTEYLDDGHLEALVRRVVRRLRPLRDTLREELEQLAVPGMEIAPSRNGLQLHVTLRGCTPSHAVELAAHCAQQGIGVFPDAPYSVRSPRHAGLIFGFATMTPERIREGIRRFGHALAEFRGNAW